jgi:hypothetical protein
MYKKVCEECKVEYIAKDRRSKFCCRSCSAAHRNKVVLTKEKIKKICLQCGVEYLVKPCVSEESKYCSKKCKSNGWINHGEYIYRKKAIELLGSTCSYCGSENNIVVHHIDGNHCNNDPKNWKISCKRCHTMINHREQTLKNLNASHRKKTMKE